MLLLLPSFQFGHGLLGPALRDEGFHGRGYPLEDMDELDPIEEEGGKWRCRDVGGGMREGKATTGIEKTEMD